MSFGIGLVLGTGAASARLPCGKIDFGCAVRAATLQDPALRRLLLDRCRSMTPELGMKWAAFAPEQGRTDAREADAIAAFARLHALRLRGHTLIWHRSIPDWAMPRLVSGADWRIVGDHIGRIVNRYGSLVDEWDVVNEPIDIGARPDGLRDSPFLVAFGPRYIERAFREARAAAPKARLLINDYDLEYDIPAQAERRAALLALVKSLRATGVPIDGIGIQAHLEIGKGPFSPQVFRDFLKSIADLGLSISITELDVKERDLLLPAPERDAAVADHAARFLEAALVVPAVRSLTCWGLSDRQSWLEVTAGDRARFPGAWADGSSPGLNRGLPYDSSLRPKPMQSAIENALENHCR